MALVAPPSRWQSEDTGGAWNQDSQPRAAGSSRAIQSSNPQAAEVDTVNNAWKHVKAVVVNDGKAADLLDLLVSSPTSSIDSMPIGWPSLLRPVSSMMGKMPAMVMQRFNACQVVCFCGVFPSIRRAWASVDNSLFLWRFDKWNDVPLEYNNEEQAICAVGLVKPRSGVFAEAIQQLLVVCTTTEVVLLGVCCAVGDSDDPLNELSIIPLPGSSISSDGVTMCATASTPDGRIFLGGGDGHLYEVVYNKGGGWRQKRCAKVDHSRGFSAYLPSLIPPLWQTPSPILEIIVDTSRHILYTRSQKSSIVVYDLGAGGKDTSLKKVAELSDLQKDASAVRGGENFRGRSPADRAGAGIVHLAVIPPAESTRVHLVVVTRDGRRVFFTTISGSERTASPSQRPTTLQAVIARQAPPQPATAAARGGGPSSTGVAAGVALYSNSLLLLSEVAQDGRSRLLVTARDVTIPPVGSSVTNGTPGGLREVVGELEMLVPGETCSIHCVDVEQPLLPAGQIPASDDLAAQVTSQPPRFVLVSTAGVLELEKRRPVEILQQMMEERSSSKMDQFFKSFGAAEVAAMCFCIAAATSSDPNSNVVQQAKEALENPALTGQAQMKTDLGAETSTQNPSFDMGQAVPVAEPEWSGAHKGLCTYLARLLHPVWEEPVVSPVAPSSSEAFACSLPVATLEAFEARLLKLEGFLKDYQQRRRSRASNARAGPAFGGEPSASGRGAFSDYPQASNLGNSGMPPSKRPRLEEAAKQEDQRVAWVRGLVSRTAESCFLLSVLSRHHMPRLTARLNGDSRTKLGGLKLRDLVCSSEGETLAAQLISVLVTEHLTASGGVASDLAARLQAGCPSYFKEDDKTFYQASGLLQRAENTTLPAEREDLVNQAVKLMMKVPLACDLGRVVPQLATLRHFSGCVELPLKKADLLDPTGSAAIEGPEGKAGREARYESCYAHVMNVLKDLNKPGAKGDHIAGLNVLLQRAAAAPEPYFHEVLYTTLIDLRAQSQLLGLDSPDLEKHLRTNGGMPPSGVLDGPIGPLTPGQVQHLELLAKLYIRRGRHDLASQVWEVMAVRKGGLGDKSISLKERQAAFENAVIEAKANGDPQDVREVELRCRILDLQTRLADALAERATDLEQGSPDQVALMDSIAELKEQPKGLAVLYNDYAVPYRVWSLCLEMVAAANHNDPSYNRQLWDAYLTQTWDKKRAEMTDANEEARAQACFQECCLSVEHLGAQMFGLETVFPAAHVCLRLELAALGNWPYKAPATTDPTRVATAMLKACKGNRLAVVRVYDALLSQRGGDETAEQVHLPIVRLALLRSQLALLTPQARQLLDQPGITFMGPTPGFRREAGTLIQECRKYAAEAGRLQPAGEADEVARSFNQLAEELDRVSARR